MKKTVANNGIFLYNKEDKLNIRDSHVMGIKDGNYLIKDKITNEDDNDIYLLERLDGTEAKVSIYKEYIEGIGYWKDSDLKDCIIKIEDKKSPEVLTWVFFGSQGIIDNTDLMRCLILCQNIIAQGNKATVESIKNTGAYVGCIYDIPNKLLTDEIIQKMIDFKI